MTAITINLDDGSVSICQEGKYFKPATLDRDRLELAIRILKRTLDDPWRGFDAVDPGATEADMSERGKGF